MRSRGGYWEADLHFYAGDVDPEYADDDRSHDHAEHREDDRYDDDGRNRRERPLDDDRDHAPERNVDVCDRDTMRRGRRLNGHGWPSRLCPAAWLAKVSQSAMGVTCASSILTGLRARNGARA